MDAYTGDFPLFGEIPVNTDVLTKLDRLEGKVMKLEKIYEQIEPLMNALKKM